MNNFDRKKHWENIYQTKELTDVSWYQPIPETSLNFFKRLNVPTTSSIIDVGGGDSFLADHLLEVGYKDISVLDISENAIERAKNRLGKKSDEVNWIVKDISKFTANNQFDVWHDRAAFHFLTDEKDISNYVKTAYQSLNRDGILIIGSFSENGPKKCSGIEITQYSEQDLITTFKNYFGKINCFTIDHATPFNTIQNFTFCSFKKTPVNP